MKNDVDEMLRQAGPFARSYVDAALFSTWDESTPAGGEPLDRSYRPGDVAVETATRMISDCARFQDRAGHVVAGRASQAGHDFWMTRNGHGCGFWDGEWGDDVGDRLTELAREFGEFHLYIGDDGAIHGEP